MCICLGEEEKGKKKNSGWERERERERAGFALTNHDSQVEMKMIAVQSQFPNFSNVEVNELILDMQSLLSLHQLFNEP